MIRVGAFLSKDLRRSKFQRFTDGFDERAARGVDRATAILQAEIKRNLSLGGSVPRSNKVKGKVRIIPKNMGKHLRVITGALRSSWLVRTARRVGRYVQGHVFSRSPYARVHEYGYPAGNIPQREFVDPALKSKGDEMKQVIAIQIMEPLHK